MDFKNMDAKKVCGFQLLLWIVDRQPRIRILGWRVYRPKFGQIVPRQDGKLFDCIILQSLSDRCV